MYKVGYVTDLLGVNRSTIYNWVERYESHFSAIARKVDRPQREFTDDDLAVLNTIRHLRADNQDWDQIREMLDADQRIVEFPESVVGMDSRVVSVPHAEKAAEVLALKRLIQEKDDAIHELRLQLEKKDGTIDDINRQWREEIASLNDQYRKEVSELNRMIGKLEYLLEQKKDDE